MPIANCIVVSECQSRQHNVVELWAAASGVSVEHMTVNIVTGTEQIGKPYAVMATLTLPSLWSEPSVNALQVGLAKALAQAFNLSLAEVHVITTIVESGRVVEAGKVVEW